MGKGFTPSDELRRWFAHKPERWLEFRRRYLEELSAPHKVEFIERIARMAVNSDVTLLYAARDGEHNTAGVLEEVVARLMKDLPQAWNTRGSNACAV